MVVNVDTGYLISSKLRHPNVVDCIGVLHAPWLGIVTEYVQGGTLRELLATSQINDWFRGKIALEIARGLAFLHANCIYHRDIKPEKMMVKSTHFSVLDFTNEFSGSFI